MAAWLIAASALVVGVLGGVHLLYTFSGSRLHPRDESLIAKMQAVSPRLSTETTIWRAGVGFHASHSLGALLFAAVFASLAFAPGAPLFGMPAVAFAGAAYLLAMLVLARRFWFRIPFRGLMAANVLYFGGLATAWA